MRKRSKGFALARNTGSPLKISGNIAQPARPRSTASELYTSQPCFTKKFIQPSRPSGVVSYVTPVRPPPCHIRSGTAPRRFAGRKYCTYIASTEYVPFGSTFAGTPPGVNTTSFTGLPEISTSRPPTWNEPMSRSAIGAWAQPARTRIPRTRSPMASRVRVCIAGFYLILSAVVTAQPVRYEPSPIEVVHAMLELAQVTSRDAVYDLGCGDGRIVIAAAVRYGARGVCVDIDPQRIAESRENARRAGVEERIRFMTEDLFMTDLSDATVVTLFLSPEFNDRLRPKLLGELKPGARIVSHYHGMAGWMPNATLDVGES